MSVIHLDEIKRTFSIELSELVALYNSMMLRAGESNWSDVNAMQTEGSQRLSTLLATQGANTLFSEVRLAEKLREIEQLNKMTIQLIEKEQHALSSKLEEIRRGKTATDAYNLHQKFPTYIET